MYDRVAAVKYIERALGDLIEFANPKDKKVDFILAVYGCEVACTDLSQFKGIPIKAINSPEDAKRLVNEIKEKGKAVKASI
ncbi:MAG: hypothetical protein U9P49_02770 [Thermodesulfobacteriota bacterium]|nr:hypothetical protein [Thermodesulfobacteriota bacterium]